MSERISTTPLFIGGTGRSGTTILGDLLGAHPEISLSVPTEIKFFSNATGLLNRTFNQRDLAALPPISIFHPRARYLRMKKIESRRLENIDDFIATVDQRWWQIDSPPPHGPGLIEGISRSDWDGLIATLQKRFPKNPKKASAEFLNNYIAKQMTKIDSKYWVETTPFNIREASRIKSLLPNSRFINMTRDPRDVIASLLGMPWGPSTPAEGLIWIEERLLAGHIALSALPQSSVLNLSLEDLTMSRRDESYSKLLEFLELDDAPEMAQFFADRLSAKGAKIGRWSQEIEDPTFLPAFEEMCDRLTAQGVHFHRN